MTNRGALILAVFILAADGGKDLMIYGSDHLVFLGKKFADLIEYLAFWR
ncbi:MAG: hypothetical protein AAFO97_07915 [Pseudomonadota bacterium]